MFTKGSEFSGYASLEQETTNSFLIIRFFQFIVNDWIAFQVGTLY